MLTQSEIQRKISFLLEQSPLLEAADSIHISSVVIPASDLTISGGVAARAMRQVLKGSYSTVVLLHQTDLPLNRSYIVSPDIVPGFSTNLNYDMPLRRELLSFPGVESLPESTNIRTSPLSNAMLYLKWLERPLDVLPLVCGELQENEAEALARHIGLATASRPRTLFITATDIVSQRSIEDATGLSDWIVPAIEDMEAGLLYGIAPESAASVDVAVTFAKEREAVYAKVLLYRTTEDVQPNAAAVDGYLSAVFYRNK
ncbi:MAG: AmmeMemoRadiSam system protein B [Calditrichota bacterium]